ncbi:MAG: hypothetical protein AB7G28_04715 [Pirellulales bacterium]
MMRTGWTFVAAISLAFLVVNDALAVLIFDDGQSHVINQPSDAITVLNSAAPDDLPTTVTISTGGVIDSVAPVISAAASVFGTSGIELAGGSILTNAGGGHGLVAFDNAQIKMTSGTIAPLGASSAGISIEGNAQAEVLGGTIDATSIGLNGFGQTYSVVRGGTIRGDAEAFHLGVNSQLHVYGGLLGDMDGGVDLTVAGGEAHFYGSAFQLNGVPVAQGLIAGPGNFVGRLTGMLDSGESLDIGIRVEDLGPGVMFPALIYVHVPEPSSLLLLTCASFGAFAGGRARCRS